VLRVLMLLRDGCPMHATVATFSFDERTIATRLARASHRLRVSMAMTGASQCWLGEVISSWRDRGRITTLVWRIRALAYSVSAYSLAPLVCRDGLASNVTAVLCVRHPVCTGHAGGHSWWLNEDDSLDKRLVC
jgi:hypothetical protein